jgi:hypothetical protein
MVKESKSQNDTVERVMHEFKEGELETSTGQPVKSRRQAIAIGLSEAGASNRQSPAANKKRASRTRVREKTGKTARSRDESGRTKADLYAEAKRRNIPGRAGMSKAELEKAVG